MFKSKKEVVYRLAGRDNETPITHEEMEKFHDLTMFFVTSDGLIVPINHHTNHDILSRISGGKYMYKEQLEDLIFTS